MGRKKRKIRYFLDVAIGLDAFLIMPIWASAFGKIPDWLYIIGWLMQLSFLIVGGWRSGSFKNIWLCDRLFSFRRSGRRSRKLYSK